MRGPAVRPIVIAAGGTGGHFFPAEALAAELVRRGQRIVLMTDARSGGLRSPVFADRERHVLTGSGVFGGGAWRAVRALSALGRGALQARAILARLDAAAIVGFGGYPCVAPVLGSRLLRRRPPVILHEQNGVLGRANRLLARFADILALSQPTTRHLPSGLASSVTGNPVRPAIAALAGRAYLPPRTETHLLVLGGSLGARVLSDVVPAALAQLAPAWRSTLRVTQQCRAEDLARVRAAYAEAGIAAACESFFADIAGLLDAAHLVISRAGASTVAELAVVGRPAILVPLPGAIDDDQTSNARSLADVGGAWIMPQPGFTADRLAAELSALLANPSRLAAAAAQAASAGHADAAVRLADLVEATIARRQSALAMRQAASAERAS